ncbi:MAG: DUF4886 domain-containing protein [Rhodanobacter sp.]
MRSHFIDVHVNRRNAPFLVVTNNQWWDMNRAALKKKPGELGVYRGLGLLLAGVCIGFCAPVMAASGQRVLFVGNSFTAGMHSAAWRYQAASVHDLNGTGVGGVPALFEMFTKEAGLNYTVSVETVPGKGLKYHFLHEKAVLDHSWDAVVMQEYSTLNPEKPGDSTVFREYAHRLAELFARQNSKVEVWLMASWSRPDMTYTQNSPWRGGSIEAMASDFQQACTQVANSSSHIKGVIPVGLAFNRAISAKIADPNPYDGIDFGKVNLWAYDGHHASVYGYYLEALMDFGKITGRDPRKLGGKEQAAVELGISSEQAIQLQKAANWQLHH